MVNPLAEAPDSKKKISDDETIPTIDDFVEDRAFKKEPSILLDEDEALDDADFMDEDDEDDMPRIGGKTDADEYEEYTIEDDQGWIEDEEDVEKGEKETDKGEEEEADSDDDDDPYRRGGFY